MTKLTVSISYDFVIQLINIIKFVSQYLRFQKAKLNDEIALMRKKIADKDRLVLQCTDKLTAAERKDSEIAMLQ